LLGFANIYFFLFNVDLSISHWRAKTKRFLPLPD
jgi:hypothetical protein